MALNERHNWLIAYDIAHPRRLQRVHRYVKTVSTPVQYSLYYAQETTHGIREICNALARLIDRQADDVRIYQVPDRLRVAQVGRRPLPEGLLLVQGDPGSGAWRLVTHSRAGGNF